MSSFVRGSRSGRRFLSRKVWLEDHVRSPQGGVHVPGEEILEMSSRVRGALFRSTQRGWLELDVILGRWAAANLAKITNEKLLEQYEELLTADAPDIYRWTTRQQEPPEELAEIVGHIRAFTFNKQEQP